MSDLEAMYFAAVVRAEAAEAAIKRARTVPTRLPYNDDPNAWSADPLDGYTAEEAYERGVLDAQAAFAPVTEEGDEDGRQNATHQE